MRVFVADDFEIFRTRLIEILSEIEGIDIIGQAQDAHKALESIRKLAPDVVILDIRMEGNGINVLSAMKQENIAGKIIIFTNYPYPQYRKKCMDNGADFFFSKAIDFDKFIEALKSLIPLYGKSENSHH